MLEGRVAGQLGCKRPSVAPGLFARRKPKPHRLGIGIAGVGCARIAMAVPLSFLACGGFAGGLPLPPWKKGTIADRK